MHPTRRANPLINFRPIDEPFAVLAAHSSSSGSSTKRKTAAFAMRYLIRVRGTLLSFNPSAAQPYWRAPTQVDRQHTSMQSEAWCVSRRQ